MTAFWVLTGLRLVYVSPHGDDRNPGTRTLPVRSIQRGVNLANNGGLIKILQGDYREMVQIPYQNNALPLIIYAENTKDGQTVLLGSEPSSNLLWEHCTDAVCGKIQPAARTSTYVSHIPWDETPTMLTYKNKTGMSGSSLLQGVRIKKQAIKINTTNTGGALMTPALLLLRFLTPIIFSIRPR